MVPKDTVPLIIVGRPRSGTRYITDLLNQFPEVVIQGEIYPEVMSYIEKMVSSVEDYYSNKLTDINNRERGLRDYRRWVHKRQDLIFAMWAYCGKDVVLEVTENIRYYGYKRPNDEFYFDFYEKFFLTRPPKYIYCVRNFIDNYLSIISRWPNTTDISKAAKSYLKSLNQLNKMKQIAPDRILTFNLDNLVELGFDYIEQNIIRPLSLNLTASLQSELVKFGPRNTTEGKHNKIRRTELTEEEAKFIEDMPALDKEYKNIDK